MSQLATIREFNSWWRRRNNRLAQSLKVKANGKRTWNEKLADGVTNASGNIYFLSANIGWFLLWIAVNLNLIPGVEAFDPYPFGMLTTMVSLEAIVLAIFVLMSQNRQSRINDLREEMDVQVDMIAEQELTKALELLVKLAKKNGIETEGDEVLTEMLKPVDTDKLEERLNKEI